MRQLLLIVPHFNAPAVRVAKPYYSSGELKRRLYGDVVSMLLSSFFICIRNRKKHLDFTMLFIELIYQIEFS